VHDDDQTRTLLVRIGIKYRSVLASKGAITRYVG
jgi:hypothetical protein